MKDDDQLASIATATDLAQRLASHNWDDGFGLPQRILEHPACNFGVALQAFWLADGVAWFQGQSSGSGDTEWRTFCSALFRRLSQRHYAAEGYEFRPELGRAQRYNHLKAGVPALLLGDIG